MRPEASLQVTLGFQSAEGPSHLSPCSLTASLEPHVDTRAHASSHVSVYMQTHMHMCIRMYMYIHTYLHTHILRPTVKAAESPRHVSSPHQPLPHASLDHIQQECLPRWSAVSESPFDLGKCCFEAVPFTVESYLSFRACKLTCFERQSFKER